MKKLIGGLVGVLVLAGTFVLALPTMLHKAGMHPVYHVCRSSVAAFL
jgi:hypothetical protein